MQEDPLSTETVKEDVNTKPKRSRKPKAPADPIPVEPTQEEKPKRGRKQKAPIEPTNPSETTPIEPIKQTEKPKSKRVPKIPAG